MLLHLETGTYWAAELRGLSHPSESPHFSAPKGELCWWGVFPNYSTWGSMGISVVPVQHWCQLFLRTHTPKAVNFQACTIKTSHPRTQDSACASEHRICADGSLASLVSSPLFKQCEHSQLRLKLRKQSKEWTDSVQIIWLRVFRLVFKTSLHLSVFQLSFYFLGSSLHKFKCLLLSYRSQYKRGIINIFEVTLMYLSHY